MIAPRCAAVEINREKNRRLGDLDIAFLAQFPLQRRHQRLTGLDAAARQVPAGNVGVLDQEHAAFAVENEAADAERQTARQAPISVQKAPDRWLKGAADPIEKHLQSQAY